MTRTDLSGLFGRHAKAAELGSALAVLARGSFVRMETEKTAVRPVERWKAIR